MSAVCAICGAAALAVAYSGAIRTGRFGMLSSEPHRVLRCADCGSAQLESPPSLDYESAEYRVLVDGSDDADRYYELHDAEQAEKLRLIDPRRLRGRVIADVGCGAGSFLDFARGLAAETLAVEPTEAFHPTLTSRGHAVASYARDAVPEWGGRVDQAFCFSVIEHVENPVGLLSEIRALLGPGGELLLSTPNASDWMLELLPDEYPQFFYRAVHRWYFDARAIETMARLAGFASVSVGYVHRFDLSNLLLWLRDRRPSGTGKVPISPIVDSAFGRWLEESGRSDYLYATLRA